MAFTLIILINFFVSTVYSVAANKSGSTPLIKQFVAPNLSSVQSYPMPIGETTVCSDNKISTYKTKFTTTNDNASWSLVPASAGTITMSEYDSCKISWNNAWRGKAGISVKISNLSGEEISDTLWVESNRLPSLNLGNDTSICQNDALELKAGAGFTYFQWQDNSTTSTFNANRGGTYYVKAGNECGNHSDTIRITEIALPEIQLKDTFSCDLNPLIVDATIPGINHYEWQDGSTNPVYTITEAKGYEISVTDIHSCKNSRFFMVNNLYTPSVLFPKDTTICKNSTLTLNVYDSNCIYEWQDGSKDWQYFVTTEGVYSVTVSNRCGTAHGSMTVSTRECDAYLDVPTAFSPNGDGINDILYAVGGEVKNLQMIIYDRWGQKVFESTSFDKGWDGTYKGQKLETGVFIFYVTANAYWNNSLIQKHGNVSLIR